MESRVSDYASGISGWYLNLVLNEGYEGRYDNGNTLTQQGWQLVAEALTCTTTLIDVVPGA